MAKVLVEESSLLAIANAIREVNGESVQYTPAQMAEAIKTIQDAATYFLLTSDGREVPAVLVDSQTVFTATENDIREGAVAASNSGVVTGTKVIPSYHTREGAKVFTTGEPIEITNTPLYDYTKLQALVCSYNSTMENSVATVKVAVNDAVYNVLSADSVAEITKNHEEGKIDFGITNDTDKPQIVRYIYFKEIE